jgi:plastocyanin
MLEPTGIQVEVHVECVDGVCKVLPAEIIVGAGDKVHFKNLTDGTASIQFSEECLFQGTKAVIAAQKELGFLVQRAQRGVYPYAVYCECTGDFAVGASMPIIIIKR